MACLYSRAMSGTHEPDILPHDALVKATLAPVEHARGFFEAVLPKPLIERLDMSTLCLVPTNYVSRKLGQLYTDLFYSVKLRDGGEQILHLAFEHENGIKKLIPVRFERARCYFLEQWLRDHPKAERVPAIFPVLLHHGKKRWDAPLEYREVLDPAVKADGPTAPYVGNFRVLLVDLAHYFDDWDLWKAAFGHVASALCQLVLILLQHAPRNPDLIDFMRRHTMQLMRDVLAAPNGVDAFTHCFRYIEAVNDYLDADDMRGIVIDVAGPGAEELVVGKTIGELKREAWNDGWAKGEVNGEARGEAKGRAAGKAEVLLKLMQLRYGSPDEATTARIHGATIEDLDRWTERILDADTLDALFADEQ